MTRETERHIDVLDQATQAAENLVADGLAHVRRAAERFALAPTGFCLHCEAQVEDLTQRWCDQDCRDDWQREREAEQRNGRPE